jgi:PIN domain nuclease of toxin-antitoxin system
MSEALEQELLLDTHIVIWLASDLQRIPLAWLALIEMARRRYVSHATALEIQIKYLKNPDLFGFSLDSYERAVEELSLDQLPIAYADIKAFGSMTFLHRDPFDRLLMAQASRRNLCLVTQDKDIRRTADRYKAFRVLDA